MEDCLDLTEARSPRLRLSACKAWSRLASRRSLSSLKWSAKAQKAFLAQTLVSES